MTYLRSRQRAQVVIPAQGMIEFRDALTDLLGEFGIEDMDGMYVWQGGQRCECQWLSWLYRTLSM